MSKILFIFVMLIGVWMSFDQSNPASALQQNSCILPEKPFSFVGNPPEPPTVQRAAERYTNPGAVLFHDGEFHMFRNNFTNWPGLIRVGYLTSSDGINWPTEEETVVFTSNEVPFADPGADVSSGYVTDDGTWVLYFHTVNFGSSSVIGRMTAESPLGPWSVDAEPVLTPGSGQAWDRRNVVWPSVVQTDEGLVMFYGGESNSRQSNIGRATSTNGINWTKHNDPNTDGAFAESDPVVLPEADWDRGIRNRPEVQLTPDGWVMVFQGGSGLNNRGLAISRDGIEWTPHNANPILQGNDFPIPGTTWDTALTFNGQDYFYFMEIGNLTATNIFTASHRGLLCA